MTFAPRIAKASFQHNIKNNLEEVNRFFLLTLNSSVASACLILDLILAVLCVSP